MTKMDERQIIDGELFLKMVTGGVVNLQENLETVNDLNVFPIPDGDTGENMYLTLQGGFDRIREVESESIGDKAQAMAKGMLVGARGNSGVILSQLFFGLSEGLRGLAVATLQEFALALEQGVKRAYGAVAHPVEGTILTVAREAIENARQNLSQETSVESFFFNFLQEMKKSLERTPNLLAVLKESGVIDSGGAGLVYITEGFCKALGGEDVEKELALASVGQKKVELDFSKFDENSVMEFGYCTELLLRLQNSKCNPNEFSVENLIAFLESVGDSVVAFQTDTIVKIHVHTMEPYKVLEHCQKYGEYLTVKIENMTLQHNETSEKKSDAIKKPQRARRKYALVTVVSGKGLIDVFKELGADYVISGGQTNNPSSEDFVQAFDEVNADYVYVLPNNGNVILAAKQAAGIYDKSEIRVVESKTIGDGYAALSMLDYAADDPDEIEELLKENMAGTTTAMVARSVRSTTLNGVEVVKDQYMGFTDHVMHVCKPTKVEAACALLEKLAVKNNEFVILSYGKTPTAAEKAVLRGFMEDYCPNVEVYEVEGGQDVYDFLFIVQ
ncbi:MAG: DAK2 domain-containing protein [Clostridia bacterium]|nr:DAK2 domain-containing protein [Clostridia bacterium]